MKKRLTVIVVAVLCTLFVLSACGNKTTNTNNPDSKGTSDENNTQTSNTMTVSEMLNTVLKDNGGKMYIYYRRPRNGNSPLSKDLDVDAYLYDGKSIIPHKGKATLGEIAKGEADFGEKEDKKNAVLDVETDSTGNNTNLEVMLGSIKAYFGSFSRIQIYDKTYMCFTTMGFTYGDDPRYYTIIEDTISTKDKTIVWDSVGTDGILVDKGKVDPDEFYAPALAVPAN